MTCGLEGAVFGVAVVTAGIGVGMNIVTKVIAAGCGSPLSTVCGVSALGRKENYHGMTL